MEPESDVMAARILRGLEISQALTSRQWPRQLRTHKRRSGRLIMPTSGKFAQNVLQQIADRIARRQLLSRTKDRVKQLTLSGAL
jgi:hypothetical protein